MYRKEVYALSMDQTSYFVAMMAVPVMNGMELSASSMAQTRRRRLAAMMDMPVMHGMEVSA